jgi:hypothetical protein
MAGLKNGGKERAQFEKGVRFIVSSRSGGGGFGNTQSTILALKALTMFSKFAKRTAEAGVVEIYVDNKKVASTSYAAGTQGEIGIEGLEKFIDGGKHKIRVEYVGTKNPLPYNISLQWSTSMPNSQEECKLRMTTQLSAKSVKVGETVRLTTVMKNITKDGLPMSMAIVGIPGGLSPQPWQLKELQDRKLVDFYEVLGNDVVFYYRQMLPEEEKTIQLDLKAEIPGAYEAPASCAYLYYTNEHKHWVQAERIEVK